MRFVREPRVLKGQKSKMIRQGLSLLGLDDVPKGEIEAREVIGMLCGFLHDRKPLDDVYSSEFDVMRSKIGLVYGELIAIVANWITGYLIVKESDPYEDLVVVVSSDLSYGFSPIDLAIRDSIGVARYGFELLRMLDEGDLPKSSPGEVLDLIEYLDARMD